MKPYGKPTAGQREMQDKCSCPTQQKDGEIAYLEDMVLPLIGEGPSNVVPAANMEAIRRLVNFGMIPLVAGVR